MKKEDDTKLMTSIFIKGSLVILALLIVLSFIAALVNGVPFTAFREVIKVIFPISMFILLILFISVLIGAIFKVKTTPEVKQSVIYRDNTLKYQVIENKRRRPKTIKIDNIDAYLDKYKTMYIIDNLMLKKKNYNEKSNINNLLIVENDKSESLNTINNNNTNKYNRICSFLDSIKTYSVDDLYWRLKSYVSKENLILNGKELSDSLNNLNKLVNDKDINDSVNNTLSLIEQMNIKINDVGSKDQIRKVYDHYLPMLIKILDDYIHLGDNELDKTNNDLAKNRLIKTFALINEALNKLSDTDEEGMYDRLEASVNEVEELLQKGLK